MNSQLSSLVLEALRKKYEDRGYQDHKNLVGVLVPLFPTLSLKKIKMMTFYLQLKEQNLELTNESTLIPISAVSINSYIITFTQQTNPQQNWISLTKLGKQGVKVQNGQFIAVLEYEHYVNIQLLGETSIEKEINFLESSEYCCSMPKKKLYDLLRIASVVSFAQGQNVFNQSQLITQSQSGSGIYIIRKGEFGYYQSEDKDIQAFRFSSGHIFGVLQYLDNRQDIKNRVLTAKCKSSSGLVYHFSLQTFNHYVRHYCQQAIRQKQSKLMRYLPKLENLFKSKSYSNSQQVRGIKFLPLTTFSTMSRQSSLQIAERQLQDNQNRAFPSLRLQQIRQTASTSFYNTTMRQTNLLESQGLRRSSQESFKKEGPLRNYPMPAQRSNFLTSQFKDLGKLIGDYKEDKVQVKTRLEGGIGRSQRGVWKRDMMSSLYRQNIFQDLKRAI